MSSKRKQQTLKEQRDWERIDEAVIKSENFLEKYQRQILIGLGAIVLVVCAFLAYRTFYLLPKTEEAQTALYKGEEYFRMQEDSLALYGDGNGYIGFEAIIHEYGATKPGDLAKLYAGISYSRMGRYEQAIAYLKDFGGKDEMLTYAAKGALGDCLVNTGKPEEGLKYFLEAAKGADNALLSPIYYKKAGIIYRDMNNHDKVIEMFTAIKNNYENSPEATEADRYIQEAEYLKSR